MQPFQGIIRVRAPNTGRCPVLTDATLSGYYSCVCPNTGRCPVLMDATLSGYCSCVCHQHRAMPCANGCNPFQGTVRVCATVTGRCQFVPVVHPCTV